MARHRWHRWFVLTLSIFLMNMSLFVSGCGMRVGGGEMAAQADDAPLVVDLPALYIDYDRSGIARVGSVPVTTLGDTLGIDLSALNLAPQQLEQIIDAHIQHIQITSLPQRLLILINGRVVPSLGWATAELENTGATLAALVPALAPLEPLLPIAAEMGIGLVLRFPLAPGATPLALELRPHEPARGEVDQEAYLAAIGGLPPRWTIDVYYQNDGTWRVDGLDAAAWSQSVPLPWEKLNLDVAHLHALRNGGIEELILSSNREGLFLQVNQEPLPYLSWTNGALQNVVTLADEGGIFQQLLGDSATAYSLATTLERLLPLVQLTELELRVHFATNGPE